MLRTISIVISLACCCTALAQQQADSLRTLRDIEVDYRRPPQGISRTPGGSLRISSTELQRGLHTLGEADALRVATMMPGLSSVSDYASGVMIDGSDYTQTAYTYDGARVFFPYHFGGIFSDFNSAHIGAVVVGSPAADAPMVAGGTVGALTSDLVAERLSVQANLGLLASSATMRTPLWRGASVTASARAAYINWLYGRQMQRDSGTSRYDFDDFNLTLLQRLDSTTQIKVSALYSTDHLDFGSGDGDMDASLRWHNTAATMRLARQHSGVSGAYALDYSDMASTLAMGLPQMAFVMPASVGAVAAHGHLVGSGERWQLAYRSEWTRFSPQSASLSGDVDLDASPTARRMSSWLGALAARYRWPLDVGLLEAGARVSAYASGGYHHVGLDPSVSLSRGLGGADLTLALSALTQYVHHIGLSDIGAASNYFLPATSLLPPERSMGAELRARWRYGAHWSVDAKAFYRRVVDAAEYSGSILDLISDSYDPLASAITARGFNVGGNVVANYDYSALSGWIGADLSVCRRRYADDPGHWRPSSSEPLWSAKALVQWRVHPRVDFTAFFTVAAGRRYTAPEAIYCVGGNILTEYGARNGAHLPTYQRLDLSASWRLPLRVASRTHDSWINLSVLNVYGHRNIEMQYFTYDSSSDTIRLRRVCSLYRFLPSLSYNVRF